MIIFGFIQKLRKAAKKEFEFEDILFFETADRSFYLFCSSPMGKPTAAATASFKIFNALNGSDFYAASKREVCQTFLINSICFHSKRLKGQPK